MPSGPPCSCWASCSGPQERTQELIAFIDSQTAELTSRTAGVADEDRPGVYICGLGNWGTTDHLMTSQSYAAFRVANIRNVATDLGKDGVQPIEAEKFAALGDSMDIMILGRGGGEEHRAAVSGGPPPV